MNYIWLIVLATIGYFAINYLLLRDKLTRTKIYVDSKDDLNKEAGGRCLKLWKKYF